MKYFSIFRPDTDSENCQPPSAEMMEQMGAFCTECMQNGSLLYTEGLMPGSMGARVRLREGQITVTDHAKSAPGNQIGGFAILQGSSKEEVIELAKRFLTIVGGGETELLPVFEMGEGPCHASECRETVGAGII